MSIVYLSTDLRSGGGVQKENVWTDLVEGNPKWTSLNGFKGARAVTRDGSHVTYHLGTPSCEQTRLQTFSQTTYAGGNEI